LAVRPNSGVVLTAVLLAGAWRALGQSNFDPHGDSGTGVLRVVTDPSTRGNCSQCHPQHGGDSNDPKKYVLFADNNNGLCFSTQGASPCHQARPDNYPLQEADRLPAPVADSGYFEAHQGSERRPGVELRGRWPGEHVYSSPEATPDGHYLSPHAQDPDMPRRDSAGEGLCLNCHDPHGTPFRDLLTAQHGGIGGHGAAGPPAQYALCFSCHGHNGPGGMEPANQLVEDFYDAGLNGEFAGHQIRKNPNVAISWPLHVQVGDMLPCYDCHDPHGSQGNNAVQPNAFVLSDQRSGWSDLTDTVNDAAQARHFCLGCHIPSDGIPGSQTVEGILMNVLSGQASHVSTATESCYECHGRDYTSPTGHNVHNPSGG
jgi:predicted CXXCH cytochrome family protein